MNFDHPDQPEDLTPEQLKKVQERTGKLWPAETRKPEAPTTRNDEPTPPPPPIPERSEIDAWLASQENPAWYVRILASLRDAAIDKISDPATTKRIVGWLVEWLLGKLAKVKK